MNTREVHNIVKSAKSKLLQNYDRNHITNNIIEEYIIEELHRRTQGSGTIHMNDNTPAYTNDAYGSLKELREAYDMSKLSTDEIRELLETFI